MDVILGVRWYVKVDHNVNRWNVKTAKGGRFLDALRYKLNQDEPTGDISSH